MITNQENTYWSLLLEVEESSLVPGAFHPKVVLLAPFPLALPPAVDGQVSDGEDGFVVGTFYQDLRFRFEILADLQARATTRMTSPAAPAQTPSSTAHPTDQNWLTLINIWSTLDRLC